MATLDEEFEFTVDRSWRITSISESAAAWSGSAAQDLIGRDGRTVNPAATRQLAGAIDAALLHEVWSTLEQPSAHVPGRWVRIEVSPSRTGARIRFEDVTSRISRLLGGNEDAGKYRLGAGCAEIVLLDQRGVIVATNAAWRGAALTHGLPIRDAGVGARYSAVCKAVLPELDEPAFQTRLDELLLGRTHYFEATYELETPEGQNLRQVQIAPLRIGDVTYFAAIHEDLSERAKALAAPDQLLHAQEQERQRIAVELHGSTGRHLAGLALGLDRLRRRTGEDEETRALVEEMATLARKAARETRLLSYLMNASGREREGLDASARRFVEGFGRRAGLSATFETEGPVDAVAAGVQHAVFRVIQEALSNVRLHAHARHVSVKLASEGGALTVRISDDGQGFAPNAEAEGVEPALGAGIAGMRARIEQLGGRLEIAGNGSGTTVTATVRVAG